MTTQTILGIIFLILTISPLVYFGTVAYNRSLKAKKRLISFAADHTIVLDELEFWNDKGLGIQKEKRQLVFISIQQGNEKAQIIDLGSIKVCSISVKKTTIDLLFEFKNASAQMDRIQVYNKEYDDINEVGYHNQLAIRWTNKIIELLETKNSIAKNKSA